jgi:site-specific DNA recombinase
LAQIREQEEKLSYIRDLLSSKQIEPADFREMKTEHSGKLEKIEAKLSTSNHDQVNIGDLLNKGLDKPFKAGLCV